tara:strand:+ start:3215 stop:3871 length:657 start_codon:yes stop_codon:yes gene_type:complete
MKTCNKKESKRALELGIGASFIAVICCLGPLIPILLGFGGAVTWFGLDRYNPVFIGFGFLILAGTSWYAVRRQNRCCTTKNRMKNIQIVALIFGVGIASYLALQYGVVPALSRVASEKIATQQPLYINTSKLLLSVDGMYCAGCAVGVEQALLNVPGVVKAKVDWQTGFAEVEYDPNQTNSRKILNAKVNEQYTLRIRESSSTEPQAAPKNSLFSGEI